MRLQGHLVTHDDSTASTLWKLITAVLRERCSTMCWHSHSFPGALAGTFSEDDEEADAAPPFFYEHWRAYTWARKHPLPKPQSLFARHMLKPPTGGLRATCSCCRMEEELCSGAPPLHSIRWMGSGEARGGHPETLQGTRRALGRIEARSSLEGLGDRRKGRTASLIWARTDLWVRC